MSQKKQWDPELNTVVVGGVVHQLSSITCCTPVAMLWAIPEQGGGLIGLRHMGFTCAGEFQEMPYRSWRRATFLPERKVRRK